MTDGTAATLEIPSLQGKTSEIYDRVKDLNDEEKSSLILRLLSDSNILWLSQFVKKLENTFGVSAAMAVAPAATAGAAPAQAAATEEKTSFDIVLKDIGANKVQVIKVVKSLLNLGLMDAKALVEKAPTTLKENMPKDEAEKIKKEIENSGAKVELK